MGQCCLVGSSTRSLFPPHQWFRNQSNNKRKVTNCVWEPQLLLTAWRPLSLQGVRAHFITLVPPQTPVQNDLSKLSLLPPSQLIGHRSVKTKPAKLHTVHESMAAYTLVCCQTYLWAHVPQDGPVHPPGASNDGAQLPWAVFHQRAGKPHRRRCLAPGSSWHGSALGRESVPSIGWSGMLGLNQWVVFLALWIACLYKPVFSCLFAEPFSVTKGVSSHSYSLMWT